VNDNGKRQPAEQNGGQATTANYSAGVPPERQVSGNGEWIGTKMLEIGSSCNKK
jgi:hypothetical protein